MQGRCVAALQRSRLWNGQASPRHLVVPEFVTGCGNDDGPMRRYQPPFATCEYISGVRASETGFPPRKSAPTTLRYEQSQSPSEIAYFATDLSAINDDALSSQPPRSGSHAMRGDKSRSSHLSAGGSWEGLQRRDQRQRCTASLSTICPHAPSGMPRSCCTLWARSMACSRPRGCWSSPILIAGAGAASVALSFTDAALLRVRTMLIDEAGNEIGCPRYSTGAAVPGNAKYRRRKQSGIQPRSAL
jgi:hypothetical protein